MLTCMVCHETCPLVDWNSMATDPGEYEQAMLRHYRIGFDARTAQLTTTEIEIGILKGLIEQLLDVVEGQECQDCGVGYATTETGCAECAGERAAIEDARNIATAESRAAFATDAPKAPEKIP